MEPIIVGDRVYTSLAAAVADQPEGKGFTYSHARLAPPNVPPGELIQDLIVKAMYELNPKSADHSTLWKRYGGRSQIHVQPSLHRTRQSRRRETILGSPGTTAIRRDSEPRC